MGGTKFRNEGADAVQPADPDFETRAHSEPSPASRARPPSRRSPGSDAELVAVGGVAGGADVVEADIGVQPLRMGAPIGIEGRQHAAAGAQQIVGMPDDGAVWPGLVGEAQQFREGLLGARGAVAPDQGGIGRGGAATGAGMAMDEEAAGRRDERALDHRQHGRDMIRLRAAVDAGFGIAEAHDQRIAARRLMRIGRRLRHGRIEDADQVGRAEARQVGVDGVEAADLEGESVRHARASAASRSAIAGIAAAATLAKAKRRNESCPPPNMLPGRQRMFCSSARRRATAAAGRPSKGWRT